MEMLVALICGILLGILSINFGRLVGAVNSVARAVRSVDIELELHRTEMERYRIDLDRFDHIVVDLLCTVCDPKSDPSGFDQEKDDRCALSFSDMLSDLPDWPVEDTREEDLDDEA